MARLETSPVAPGSAGNRLPTPIGGVLYGRGTGPQQHKHLDFSRIVPIPIKNERPRQTRSLQQPRDRTLLASLTERSGTSPGLENGDGSASPVRPPRKGDAFLAGCRGLFHELSILK